jgi:serine protease inhibitor
MPLGRPPQHVSSVIQQAKFIVTEHGTKAAVATGITFGVTATLDT